MRSNEAPILWRVENRVGHLVFNRPEAANALNSASGPLLADAIAQAQRLAERGEIGAVLMSARGRQFCAGGDIEEFVERRADLDRLVGEMLDLMHPAIHALATLPLPVVSALQGPIGGAGIAVALSADIVLASTAMKLRGGYSAIGLSPDLGASFQLVRRAGPARAKNILMTNRPLAAEQCLAWGLVDELYAPEALASAALALAEGLAQGATGSLAGIKRLCDGAYGGDLKAHLALEREALLRAARSDDGREGVSAFIDKRAPRFGRASANTT
ncbi:enoyl-CoA hydratase-related protein [Variovorax sp. J22P168]|uniref:enoyl-CoA hydratase/isomerase family protein n=1 Tax=Variovorax jilinensis TaxID=3053513 RepID=UPI00257631A2|nr:enoyl-CoA hydratase-related protein [Variovorax sp. J22P168]MDM0014505.1 enoyl-CoA hydratase-related protein [Variovorax sp. J22P168]